jgi:hypothetical protein
MTTAIGGADYPRRRLGETRQQSSKELGRLSSADVVKTPSLGMERFADVSAIKSAASRVIDSGYLLGYAKQRFGESNVLWMQEVLRNTAEFRQQLKQGDLSGLSNQAKNVVAMSGLLYNELQSLDRAYDESSPYVFHAGAPDYETMRRRLDVEADVIEHMPDGMLRQDAVSGKPGEAIREISARASGDLTRAVSRLGEDESKRVLGEYADEFGAGENVGVLDGDVILDADEPLTLTSFDDVLRVKDNVDILITQATLLSMENARREFNAEHGVDEKTGRSFVEALSDGDLDPDDVARLADTRVPDGYTAQEYEFAQLDGQSHLQVSVEGLQGERIALAPEDFALSELDQARYERLVAKRDERMRQEQAAAGGGGAGGGGNTGASTGAGGDAGDNDDIAKLEAGEITPEEYMRAREKAAMEFYKNGFQDNPYLRRDLKSPEEVGEFVRKHQDQYAGLLIGAVLQPLSRGIDSDALANVAVTATLMWLMSPQFRGVVKDTFDEFDHELKKRRNKLMSNKRSSAYWGTASQRNDAKKAANDIAKRFDTQMRAAGYAGKKGYHYVMPADVAATTLVQLSDCAYEAMRDESTPVEYVQGMHEKTVNLLLDQWEKEGLDRGEVLDLMRDEIASRMAEDPAYAMRFEETLSGQIAPTTRKKMRGPNGEVEWRWDGKMDFRGEGVVKSTSPPLTPRKPQSAEDHVLNAALNVACDIRRCGSDADAVRDVLAGYAAGWQLKDVDVREVAAEGRDPDRKVAAASSIRACARAMSADGISAEDQDAIFKEALGQALQFAENENPEVMAVFRHDHGQTWQADGQMWAQDIQKRAALNEGYIQAPVWAGASRSALEVTNYANELHIGEHIGPAKKAPEGFVPKGMAQGLKEGNIEPPKQTLGMQEASRLKERYGVDTQANSYGRTPSSSPDENANIAQRDEPMAGSNRGSGYNSPDTGDAAAPYRPQHPGPNSGPDGKDGSGGAAALPSGGKTLGAVTKYAPSPNESEMDADAENDTKVGNADDDTRRKMQQRLRNQRAQRARSADRLRGGATPAGAVANPAAQGNVQPMGVPAVADGDNSVGTIASSRDSQPETAKATPGSHTAYKRYERSGVVPRPAVQDMSGTAGRHVSQDEKKAVVNAHAATSYDKPVMHRGVTPSQAQQREAESYNNDYSTAPEDVVNISYDDPSSPTVEETKGMSQSVGASRKTARSMLNLAHNDEYYAKHMGRVDDAMSDRVMQVRVETERMREEFERRQAELAKGFQDNV